MNQNGTKTTQILCTECPLFLPLNTLFHEDAAHNKGLLSNTYLQNMLTRGLQDIGQGTGGRKD